MILIDQLVAEHDRIDRTASAFRRYIRETLAARYAAPPDPAVLRGDGCVLCPAMGEGCEGLEAEWWNEWEWEECADHLASD